MIVLFESPKGYSLLDRKSNTTTVLNSYSFSDQNELIDSFILLGKGKLPTNLSQFLNDSNLSKTEKLIVGEKKLAKKISSSLDLQCDTEIEIFREIKANTDELSNILGFSDVEEYRSQTLFLAHKLCTEKLSANPEIVDNMAIQAINMLDDLDNDINMHCMRIKEWYGCHFPELSEIIADNYSYLKVVQSMKNRNNLLENEEIAIKLKDECNLDEVKMQKIKSMAVLSVGTILEKVDLEKILASVNTIIKSFLYRDDLNKYLSKRMISIAPNLTALVGDSIGAKLISKIGSLSALSKAPASTIQILGAEKAYFMAIKGKTNTPKYGIIYHAPLLGKISQEKKGVLARMLANKIAIAVRIDFYRDRNNENIKFDDSFGVKAKEDLEKKIVFIENKNKGKRKKDVNSKRKFEFKNSAKYNEGKDASNKRHKKD